MRTAGEVLEELTSHVMPPRGISIEIKEMPSIACRRSNSSGRPPHRKAPASFRTNRGSTCCEAAWGQPHGSIQAECSAGVN